jgi:hypothetical protein
MGRGNQREEYKLGTLRDHERFNFRDCETGVAVICVICITSERLDGNIRTFLRSMPLRRGHVVGEERAERIGY